MTAPEFTTSPALRLPVRKDLQWIDHVHFGYSEDPDLRKTYDEEGDAFIKEIEKTLNKEGYSLHKREGFEEAPSISIAYPKRLSGYGDVKDETCYTVRTLQRMLEEKTKRSWSIAEDIFQVNNSPTQRRAIGGNIGKQPFFASATAFKPDDRRKLFIIADDIFDRGTTMAGLISYIESHGGKVLSTVVNRLKGQPILEEDKALETYIANSSHPEKLRSAIDCALNHADPASLEGDCKALYNLTLHFRKLGLDIRHVLDTEMSSIKSPNEAFDPIELNRRLEHYSRDANLRELSEQKKLLLRQHDREQGVSGSRTGL